MRVGIIDYGLGNLASVAAAVERAGGQPVVSESPGELAATDRLVLPGAGAFGDGMQSLRRRGLAEALDDVVRVKRKPLLGICLGAQLLCTDSDELGMHEGLGWIPAQVRRFESRDRDLRVPHVGWDELAQVRDCPLFADVPPEALFYYVHSYRILADDPAVVAGTCDYGGVFAAVVQQRNVYGTQFHPEKSQLAGLAILRNFLERS